MAEPKTNPNADPGIDIQAEIEKARKQERDKLHANLEDLKSQLAEKVKACNENFLTISNLQKDVAKRDKDLQEVEARINKAKEDGKLEGSKDIEALQKELEEYKAKLAKSEKDFSAYKAAEELNKYLTGKIKDIDEDFRPLVKGNTQEEIDASYEQVKALQNTVKEKYSKQTAKPPLPTPKTSPKAPEKTESLIEKLNNMSFDEYKAIRAKGFKQ